MARAQAQISAHIFGDVDDLRLRRETSSCEGHLHDGGAPVISGPLGGQGGPGSAIDAVMPALVAGIHVFLQQFSK